MTLSGAATVIPCMLGQRAYSGYETQAVYDGAGVEIARLTQAPRLIQQHMVRKAAEAGQAVRAIPEDGWIEVLGQAGRFFGGTASMLDLQSEARFVSRASGLPSGRVLRAWQTLTNDLYRMRDILIAQSPEGTLAPYGTGASGHHWWWVPAGRHVAVRVPGNFPTISITWLIALAARRPVLLCASPKDPFTPLRMVKALYQSGLPDGSISLCYGDAPGFWALADQVLWPGDAPRCFAGKSGRVKLYHQGRSKTIVFDGAASPEVWARVAALAVQGCGRLCTNVSTVLVDRNAKAHGEALAEALLAYPVLPLENSRAIVPAFPDRRLAEQIAATLKGAAARGAVDLSWHAGQVPLLIELDGWLFLRPTVLLVEPEDPLFGAEYPFPFVTVSEVLPSEMTQACRGSLIVSLVGAGPGSIEDMVQEPSIDKVFYDKMFDRGYDPADPHEGFLADFLFRKKAVFPEINSIYSV